MYHYKTGGNCMNKYPLLYNIFKKCDIAIDGDIISKEQLMQFYKSFLNDVVDDDLTKTGVIMHTGSICFDAMLIITATLSCILNNDYDAVETIYGLKPDDLIIFGKEKYYFKSIEKNSDGVETIVIELRDKSKLVRKLPKTMWNQLTPYYGNSKKSGGYGIKKNNKITAFYQNVLNVDKKDIPSVIDSSAVIVMSKERAEYLFSNLSIISDHTLYKLNELVTASYFSENKEYQIGSNSSKNESVLQFTSQLYVAGERLRDRYGNKKVGVIVTGDNIAESGTSEIPELLKKRSLKYSMLSFNIDSSASEVYPEIIDDFKLFPCTKEVILKSGIELKAFNPITNDLRIQGYSIINKEIESKEFETIFTWKRCSALKRKIKNIKNYDFKSDEKDRFVIQSFALFNLMLTASFDFSIMDRMVDNNELDINTVIMRIHDIQMYATKLPEVVSEQADYVVNELESMYNELLKENPKYDCLKSTIDKYNGSKIAVVVPKNYYIGIMKKSGIYDLIDNPDNLLITTANRFNKQEQYDIIIVVGEITGTKFDIFRCQSSEKVLVLLYETEDKYFRYCRRKYEDAIYTLNKISYVDVEYDEFYSDEAFDDEVEDADIIEIQEIDTSISEYSLEYNLNDFSFLDSNAHCRSSQEAEVVALAIMENDEKAFFTKRYRAYVYIDEEIKKVDVQNLSAGDVVLFTINNSETADIVDIILKRRIAENKYSEDIVHYYELSKKWKTGLREYIDKRKVKESIVAKTMVNSGISVEAATIMGWLDEGSRTVGPHDPESIKLIGHLIKDQDMEQNYIEHHNACRIIRHIRNDILKEIANVIIYRLSGQTLDKTSEFYDIYERLEAQSELLTIKSITPIDRKLPTNMVNCLISQ